MGQFFFAEPLCFVYNRWTKKIDELPGGNMRIVTSHTNTDFDALASMVACTCLYPGTIAILPSHIMPGVKAFLAIHKDLLRIRSRKDLDLDLVESMTILVALPFLRQPTGMQG